MTDIKDINTQKKCSYAEIRALRGTVLRVVLYLQLELSGLALLHWVEIRQNYLNRAVKFVFILHVTISH